MNDIELARLLLGDSKTSSTSATSAQSGTSVIPGRTRTYTAVALTDSVDGMVTVRVNGDVVGADGSGAVTLPTQAVVHEGDNVNVVVVNGSPMVTGSAGWGDQVAGTIVAQRIETEQLLATKASIDSLNAQTARIDVLVGDVADFGTLVAGKASIDDLNAATARIGTLETDHVSVSDFTAATGRIGDLEADHVSVSDLTAATGRIGDLEADHVSVSDFQAEQGYIDTLQANTADIDTIRANAAKVQNLTAQQLEADHATISALDATYATIDSLDAATGRIGDLEADHVSVADFQAEQGYIDTLQANTADISDIRANAAKVANLTAQQLEADHATIGSLSTTYAQIDMANVDNSWIQNGTIKDGAITNAMINSVSANKLTAGTIDASAITVTNLNASNITTGTINGQRIGTGSLSLDKLSEDVYTESEVDAKLSSMQDQIDGAIETWTGTAVPTLSNTPASNWTTAADRDKHVGDVYFVVNSNSQQNGYNYRFTKSGSTYSWQLIKDNDVTQALSRLSAAEGKITSIEAFDSDISSWKTDTDEELASYKSRTTSLETRVTDAENDISEKVDTSTFNTLSQTVDGNSSSITNLSTVVTNNGLTSSTNITNTVNTVSQTATGNSSKITQLTTTLGTNADGTSKEGDIVHRTSAVEQDLSGFKTTVSNTYATTTALGGVESTANNANNKLVAYSGTSSTAATTTTKVVACTNFALSAGATITVRFSVANTATNAISLNVNSTGAKQIYVNGAVTGSTNQLLWAANANITFTYDGTYWRVDSEPRSWYGSCSTPNSTAAKTATINEVVICKGTQVVLNMANDNTSANATLNVTSTAAKNIYYGTTTTRPTTANGYGWTAASTATFVFDGAYWRIGDTSAMSKITATNAVVSQHTTKIDQNANAISLKADSSTTYTKTDVDGLISTEVTNRNAAIKTASDNISLSVSETYATQSDLEDVEDRVSSAEASISVNAGNIESKVSKNGVISSINQSSESITIDANRVNIAGAAIFTSGRLSETTLNSTYATPDDIPTNVSELTNDSGFQTATQVNTAITSKGYQTAAQVESAITGKGYATKAQANDQEQLIYRSAGSGTSSMAGTTTWITASGDTQNAWTTKRPTYSASYPVLFVATQRKSVSGSVTCTTPVKDDTTTVIDGGHITTGTIDASRATITNINASNISSGTLSTNRLDAATITSNIVQTAELNASKITSGTLSTNRLDAATITSNIVQTAELNASKITSGTLSTNRLDAATIVSNIVQTAELNASKITSGILAADRIDAGTLSVEKIITADQERILNYKLSDTINDVRDSLENFSETTTADISTITERVNNLDAELDTKLDGEYLKEWLKADAGKLELGRTGSGTTVKAVLDSEKLTFENQGKAVATYGGTAGMSVPNATVESELHIGGFMLVKRNNGHLTLKYVG